MAFRKYYYNLNVELSLTKIDDNNFDVTLKDEGSGNSLSIMLDRNDINELIGDLQILIYEDNL